MIYLTLKSPFNCTKNLMEKIIHDWCGWMEQYGRFTHHPTGDTLVCQAWMGQSDWDNAQLEWFLKYPVDIAVNEEDGSFMGSVGEIVERLNDRRIVLGT